MVVCKINLNKQVISSAQIRLIMHFKICLVVKTITIVHQWCKCKLHPSWIISIKLKQNLWWTLREVCSIIKIKRKKFHQCFHLYHASHRVKPVFSEWGEIIILLILLSTKLMCSRQKCNHHQWIPVESSKPLQCITTVLTWWVSNRESQVTKKNKQVRKRWLLQCSCKMHVQLTKNRLLLSQRTYLIYLEGIIMNIVDYWSKPLKL